MGWTSAGLLASSLVVASCSGGGAAASTSEETGALNPVGRGTHGIESLYPTDLFGIEWSDSWGDGGDVLDDPWLESGSRDVRYEVEDGTLVITGGTHRLYVRDPAGVEQWGDVEVTVYFKRVADDNIPYSGMTSVVRTNHLETNGSAPCDTRGLSARLRNDGLVDFGKEVSHPGTVAEGQRRIWPDGLPEDVWIGYKHVVYDTKEGVVQEVWVDTSGGTAGGLWVKVASHVDEFSDPSWGDEKPSCGPDISPTLPLTNDETREGSESGKPNRSVYFRADGLWEDGLQYKWASVREITVE